MGHVEFRAERDEKATNPLWTGYAIGMTADEIRVALEAADVQLRSAETTRYVVRLQAIRALAEAGMSARTIASTLGLSKSVVGRHLRLGVSGVAVADRDFTASSIRRVWGDEG